MHCWSAGCASGEEVYSLKLIWEMDLAARLPKVALRIVATDAEATMLRRAKQACYALGSLKDLPAQWRFAAFVQEQGGYCVTPRCRSDIDFQLQDIRREMPEGPFHLILCRNLVFTYFEMALQTDILLRLLDRLRPSGFLVIGKHESLPVLPGGLSPVSCDLQIYQKLIC